MNDVSAGRAISVGPSIKDPPLTRWVYLSHEVGMTPLYLPRQSSQFGGWAPERQKMRLVEQLLRIFLKNL